MKKVLLPGLLSGLVMVVFGTLIGFLFGWILPSLNEAYANSGMFRAWNDPLMYLFYVAPFITGIGLAWVWDKTKKLFKGKLPCKRGVKLGLIYWLLASLPGMVITYSSFQVSLLMVLSWSVMGLVQAMAGGLVVAKMNK